jgi:hypothetical protein
MKIVIKVLLAAAIGLLLYMCYESVMTPIRFEKESDARKDVIVARLMEIRRVQVEYKNRNGVHAANFDELATFLNEERLPFVLREGTLTDEQLEKGITEQEAARQGLIRRDTFWVVAKDTLLGRDYDVANMRIVPGTNVEFEMDTITITSTSGYSVQVFECGVKYEHYLGDLDPQLLANIKLKDVAYERYQGLRVGSLTEINNYAGNWE